MKSSDAKEGSENALSGTWSWSLFLPPLGSSESGGNNMRLHPNDSSVSESDSKLDILSSIYNVESEAPRVQANELIRSIEALDLNPSADEFIPFSLLRSSTSSLSRITDARAVAPLIGATAIQESLVHAVSSARSAKDPGISRQASLIFQNSAAMSIRRKRNMTQGRKDQRRRAMIRRAMRHLLEWPLDKQEKCIRNYGLLILNLTSVDTPEIEEKEMFVLPCKEVRKLCECNECVIADDSQFVDIRSETVSRETASNTLKIYWNDGHCSTYYFAELKALHQRILNSTTLSAASDKPFDASPDEEDI